jgi:hypothetical protein
VQRTCDVCGRDFEAKRKDAKTCSATCRSNKRNMSAPTDAGDGEANSLVKATKAELEAAGKLDTMLGQQALALAKRMSGEVTGIAALSKELSRVMSAAVANTPGAGSAPVADEIDELRKRRNAKRAAG